MQDLFENQMQKNFERLKIQDASDVPSLEDVLGRKFRASKPLVNARTLGLVFGVMLLAGFGAFRAVFDGEKHKARVATEAFNSTEVDPQLDFEAMYSAIDTHFAIDIQVESQIDFDWIHPTDMLLAVNLKDSIDDTKSK